MRQRHPGHPRIPGPSPPESESPAYFPQPTEEAIIHPRQEPGEELVGPTVIMTFTRPDYQALGRLIGMDGTEGRIWDCGYRCGRWQDAPLTLVAPAMGAPYAVMVLEKLIVLGAKRVLVLGWCGSLSPQAPLGYLVLPDRAIPGDGTSPHYSGKVGEVLPHPGLLALLKAALLTVAVPWLSAPVYSTDAFYRETPGLVHHCRSRGAVALDLELAALLAASRFRGVAAAGLLVVSDELFRGEWRPARGAPPFRAGRQAALRLILDAAAAAEKLDV